MLFSESHLLKSSSYSTSSSVGTKFDKFTCLISETFRVDHEAPGLYFVPKCRDPVFSFGVFESLNPFSLEFDAAGRKICFVTFKVDKSFT